MWSGIYVPLVQGLRGSRSKGEIARYPQGLPIPSSASEGLGSLTGLLDPHGEEGGGEHLERWQPSLANKREVRLPEIREARVGLEGVSVLCRGPSVGVGRPVQGRLCTLWA